MFSDLAVEHPVCQFAPDAGHVLLPKIKAPAYKKFARFRFRTN
jgi:hypothetical protein